MGSLSLTGINKSYGKVQVLHDIALEVEDGEFVIFVGPSGCGKSTLLRSIAGLEDCEQGEIRIDGEIVNHLPPSKRSIAMVFQTYALYPHMTVRKNMSLALKQAGESSSVIEERVQQWAKQLQLTEYLDRRPAELSGGQRQRVAIGRAIVRNPKLFLFDEPLSNLDAALRVNTRIEIAKLHREIKATMVYVTHDQVEAMTLADKIVVLNDGRIEQIGSPMNLYNDPDNVFVAGFIGSPAMNFIPAKHFDGLPDSVQTVGLRPEDISLDQSGGLQGVVSHQENLGAETNVYVQLNDRLVTARLRGQHDVQVGSTVSLSHLAQNQYLFDADGKRVRI